MIDKYSFLLYSFFDVFKYAFIIIHFIEYMAEHSKYLNRFGIVSILDILGTKEMWKGNNFEKRLEDFSYITNAFLKSINESFNKHMNQKFKNKGIDTSNVKPDIQVALFSDTIIIAASIDINAYDLKLVDYIINAGTNAAGVIFFMLAKEEMFLRGSIGIGTFYKKENYQNFIIVGPTINEVANIYESDNWIGISTAPSLSLFLDKNNISSRKKFFTKYKIPKKKYNNEIEDWVFDWPRYDVNNKNSDINWHKPEKIIQEIIENKLYNIDNKSNNISYDIYLKYRNTINFL